MEKLKKSSYGASAATQSSMCCSLKASIMVFFAEISMKNTWNHRTIRLRLTMPFMLSNAFASHKKWPKLCMLSMISQTSQEAKLECRNLETMIECEVLLVDSKLFPPFLGIWVLGSGLHCRRNSSQSPREYRYLRV